MPLRKTVNWTALAVLCTACVVGCSAEDPSYRPPDFGRFMRGYVERAGSSTLPSSPVSTAPSATTRPATQPSAITLTYAIEECLAHNLAILSSNEDVNQARADVWTASLFPNPQVTVDTVLQPFQRHSLSAANPSGPPEYDVIVQYPIDWLLFGKREAALLAARKGASAAAATRADQIRQQVSATISSFYDVLNAKSSLALAEEDLQQNEQLFAITKTRAANGGVGNVELDRVQVRRIIARQSVDQARRALVAAKSSLRALLGRAEPDQSFDVIGTLEVPAQIPSLEFKDLMQLAAENRPDFLALKYKLQQAKANISSQEAIAYPQIAIAGGYSLQEQVPLGLRNTSLWSASIQASVPIFDHNQGNIRKAKSAALQALVNFGAGQVQVSTDIEQALNSFKSAHAVLAGNGKELVESATKARDKLQAGWKLGGYALLDTLDAQAAYRDALRLDLALRLDYWRSLHKLNAAVGTQILP
jgi:cobalt-zinc-cadmium efflux system outer membrane protein